MSRPDYDLIIAGAGMVGLGLAAALRGSGLRLAVLDARPPERWQGGAFDLRVSALNLASQTLLQEWQAWDAIAAGRTGAFHRIQVRDAVGGGQVEFDAADLGTALLGHIVENSLVQTALLDRLGSDPDTSLMFPARVESWSGRPAGLELQLADGRRLRTRLLVGADGAGSTVRELAEIPVSGRGYQQQGLVAAIDCEQPHGGTARQVFLPGGPLALLPLAGGGCSIVWSLPEADARERLEWPRARFIEALTRASGAPLGQVVNCGPRAAFPLRRLHAQRYIGERLALVGDAAHVIHPLAGQGVNLGFRDAAVLAEELRRAAAAGRDPGGPRGLRAYQRRRREDNLTMQWAMEGFHQLFAGADPWLARLRSAGFQLTDALAPVKREFMRRATGLGVDGRVRL